MPQAIEAYEFYLTSFQECQTTGGWAVQLDEDSREVVLAPIIGYALYRTTPDHTDRTVRPPGADGLCTIVMDRVFGPCPAERSDSHVGFSRDDDPELAEIDARQLLTEHIAAHGFNMPADEYQGEVVLKLVVGAIVDDPEWATVRATPEGPTVTFGCEEEAQPPPPGPPPPGIYMDH